MTNSKNMAIPSSTYVPVIIYPTCRSSMRHTHIHDDVLLSSPLTGIQRKILRLLPASDVLYSTDVTYIIIVSAVVLEFVYHLY